MGIPISKDTQQKPQEEVNVDQVSCYKHTAGEDQNQYVRMAAEISGNDIDFLALLDAENGLWTHDRKHTTNSNGTVDWGFCGINSYYHPEVTNDERFFSDPYWQIQKCYDYYIGGVTFYGKSKIHITKQNFTCQ